MALVLKDRVQETCTSPGTGTVTLLGAVTGYQTFAAAIGSSNTCYYTIADQSGANWEVGIGTVGSGTLARTTVLSSSNGGSLTNFSTGNQNVFVTYPSEIAAWASNNPGTSGQVLTSNGTGVAPSWQTSSGGGTEFPVGSSVIFPSFDNYYNIGAQVWQRYSIGCLAYSSSYHDLTTIPNQTKSYWTVATSPFTSNNVAIDVCSTGTNFAAIRLTQFSTSTDGITWSTPVAPGTINGAFLYYVNGTYFAFAATGTASAYSTDGVTWTTTTTGQPTSIQDMLWTGTYYLALSQSALYYSTNRTSWTTVSTAGGNALAKVGSTYVIVSNTAGVARTSSDGVTWTNQSTGISAILVTAVSDGSTLVACSNTTANNATYLATTTNGITWTVRSNAWDFRTARKNLINTASGEFYLFGSYGVYKSVDSGVNWSAVGGYIFDTSTFGAPNAYLSGKFLRATAQSINQSGAVNFAVASSGFTGTPGYIGVAGVITNIYGNGYSYVYMRTK